MRKVEPEENRQGEGRARSTVEDGVCIETRSFPYDGQAKGLSRGVRELLAAGVRHRYAEPRCHSHEIDVAVGVRSRIPGKSYGISQHRLEGMGAGPYIPPSALTKPGVMKPGESWRSRKHHSMGLKSFPLCVCVCEETRDAVLRDLVVLVGRHTIWLSQNATHLFIQMPVAPARGGGISVMGVCVDDDLMIPFPYG